MKNQLLLLTVVVGLFHAACNSKPSPYNQNDTNDTANNKIDTASASAPTTNTFADQAAIGGIMEIESSARIIKYTQNKDIQKLAKAMLKDHGAVNDALKAIAKTEKIFLPAELPSAKLQELNKLDSLPEQERNRFYIDLMVKEHENAVALFSIANESETNPKLKTFAAKHIGVLKAHYSHAQTVQKKLQLTN